MRITVGNVYSKVTQYTDAEDALLTKILCVSVPNYQFMTAYKRGHWDGTKRFYSTYKSFPSGFLPFVIEQAHKCKFIVETDDQRKIQSCADPTRLVEAYPGLRPYQQQALTQMLGNTLRTDNAVLPWSRGILKFPTNTGKTRMAACLTDFLQRKTLYLVERRELMYQTLEQFRPHTTLSLGCIGDGRAEWDADVHIAMAQTLRNLLDSTLSYERQHIERFLTTKDCLIYDECHHLANGVYHKIAMKCHAFFRYGLSASPLRRGDLGDVYLIGDVGEIIAEGERDELERQGYIGKPSVYMFTVTQPQAGRVHYKHAYRACIVENEYRNAMIVGAVRKLRKKDCTILILVKYRDHGYALLRLLAQEGLPAEYIHGQDTMVRRRHELAQLGTTNRILIATKILNEGIDLPALNAVIRAGGGESDIASLQEVGRGRDKTKVYVIDFKDCTHKDLLKHSNARIAAYETEGFAVSYPQHV